MCKQTEITYVALGFEGMQKIPWLSWLADFLGIFRFYLFFLSMWVVSIYMQCGDAPCYNFEHVFTVCEYVYCKQILVYTVDVGCEY